MLTNIVDFLLYILYNSERHTKEGIGIKILYKCQVKETNLRD